MALQPAGPSMNPANYSSLTGLLQLAHIKALQKTDDMLPATVVAYDRTTNRATVQPLVALITTNNERITRSPVASVPVLQLGGGGFVLSFPIKPGDLGWIKANDQDISLFKQSLENSPPNTQRLHSFEDSMFIPDTMFRGVTIAGEDDENVVLQSLDGTTRIALSETGVKITAATVEIDSPLITLGGIVWSTHEHTDVQAGGDLSGPPINP